VGLLALLAGALWFGLIATTANAGKLYFANYRSVERFNLSGEGVEIVLPNSSARRLALDLVNDKMYMTWGRSVYRSNLDGTQNESIHSAFPFGTEHLAVDPIGGKVYWRANGFFYANLDGSGVQLLPSVSRDLGGVALDLPNGKLYWTLPDSDAIMRANLDGSASEDLGISGLNYPSSIAIDSAGGKMYWVSGCEFLCQSPPIKIRRANLDGSNVEDLVTSGLGEPYSLVVDPTHGKIYWSDWRDERIRRANLDGSGLEELDSANWKIVYGLALAVEGLCGDGTLDRFEECDDGNVIDGDGCQSECALPLCGDGVLDAGEACDDDNAQSCDGCSDTCSIEVGLVCGDGILNAVCGEECDDGNTQDADGCQGNCLLPLCGDSILDPDEDCDDGNLELCDGCSSSCAFEPGFICGDGTANAACGEECEDGNTDSCDGCSAICTVEPGPVCGDGIVNPLCEECDDGHGLAGDRCEADCTLAPGLPVEVFHDQTDLPGSYGTPDDLVELGYVEYSSEAADDFRIVGQSRWAITEVSTRGTSYNAEIASVDIAFHANSDGQPAEVSVCSFSELTSYTDDSGNLTISLPFPCTLDPGVYWLVQQVRMDYSAGWHEWSNRTELTGNEAVWRNPGGGHTWNCLDWTPLTACDVLSDGEPDLLFQISGVELGGAAVPVFGPLGLFFIVIGLGGTGCRMLVRRHRPSSRRSPDDPRNTERRAVPTRPTRNT